MKEYIDIERFKVWLRDNGHTTFSTLTIKRDDRAIIPIAELIKRYLQEK
jgi:hypothetical protein